MTEFSPRGRWGLFAVAVALVAPLITATTLTPSPSGLATHEQLGLPPCGVLSRWHLRCPTCGMTTAYAHTVRGELAAALAASVVGTTLAVLSPLVACWAIASAYLGAWCYCRPKASLVLAVLAALAGIALCDWLVRIGPVWSKLI